MKKILVFSLLLNLAFAALFFAQCEDGSKKARARLEKEIQAAEKSFVEARDKIWCKSEDGKTSGPCPKFYVHVEKRAFKPGEDMKEFIREQTRKTPEYDSLFNIMNLNKHRLDSLRRELGALP